MGTTLTVLMIGLVIFLAHLFAILYTKTRIPDVLLLFLIGFLFGPVLKIITPAHFGAVGQVFATITLILILFDSGVGLSLKGIRQTAGGLIGLTLVNFFMTVLIVGLVGYLLTRLALIPALILGAIVGGTSSAVVIPILSQLPMSNNSKTLLIFESVINDVLCIVLTFSLVAAYKVGEVHLAQMIFKITASFLLAALMGVLFALIWSVALNKVRILQHSTFTTLAFVFIVYGLIEFMGFSGAIGALVFGYVLNNVSKIKLPMLRTPLGMETTELNEKERSFFGEIVFLLKTFFFIYIGIAMQVTNLGLMLLGAILVLLLFLLRIFTVRFTLPRHTTQLDATYMAIVVPKGLAAAVLAGIPLQQGIPHGLLIQNLTYAIVLFSIIGSSILIILVEKAGLASFYQQFWGRKFVPSVPK